MRSLLTLYTGEHFAINPPTVEELRAKCRDFLTITTVNPRNQTSQNQTSGYQKSTQMMNNVQQSVPNVKDTAQSSGNNNNWTQAPKSNVINLNRDRGNRACFSCGEEGHYMKECQAQRASLNKMGYAPPPDMVHPLELSANYEEVLKIARLKCCHCQQEGHMKPN